MRCFCRIVVTQPKREYANRRLRIAERHNEHPFSAEAAQDLTIDHCRAGVLLDSHRAPIAPCARDAVRRIEWNFQRGQIVSSRRDESVVGPNETTRHMTKQRARHVVAEFVQRYVVVLLRKKIREC